MGVEEWESGLPSVEDLTPLSQALIPPELASAFSISPVEHRTDVEVNQASQHTIASLNRQEEDEVEEAVDEEEEEEEEEEDASRTVKRPRLVWTPQLHKRFVDVVGHLGIKNAVPKTIMQLMNVEGLTRENVASHLQKYRLYLKRMQGVLTANTSVSSSTAAAADSISNAASSNPPVPVPMPMPMPIPGYHHHHWFDHHHHPINVNVHHPHSDWPRHLNK